MGRPRKDRSDEMRQLLHKLQCRRTYYRQQLQRCNFPTAQGLPHNHTRDKQIEWQRLIDEITDQIQVAEGGSWRQIYDRPKGNKKSRK